MAPRSQPSAPLVLCSSSRLSCSAIATCCAWTDGNGVGGILRTFGDALGARGEDRERWLAARREAEGVRSSDAAPP